jgi:hypothetical protein
LLYRFRNRLGASSQAVEHAHEAISDIDGVGGSFLTPIVCCGLWNGKWMTWLFTLNAFLTWANDAEPRMIASG